MWPAASNHDHDANGKNVLPPAALSSCMQSHEQFKTSVKQCIGAELEQVEKLIRAATTSRYDVVAKLCHSAAAMGGKRMRPMLVWLSARALAVAGPSGDQFDHRASRDLSSIAAAVELVHAASLVHDDVMDAATERRHLPTIVDRAGNSAAVLLGDLLFTRAYALAARCRGTYPARQIAAAATRLCEGELRQQASAGQWLMTPAIYRSLLLQKTGALCAVSCRLGAWRVGASADQVQALGNYGKLLGLAFQIHDDWLDYWGTGQVGKTLGTDLAQAKPTLPLIRLMQTTSSERQPELISMLNDRTASSCRKIRRILDASDAGEKTLEIARQCCEQAKGHLNCLPPSEAKECLIAVADYSVRRAM